MCPILSDGLLESLCSTETAVTEFIKPVFAKTSPKQGLKIRAQGSVSKKIGRNKYKKKHLSFFVHTTSIAPNHGPINFIDTKAKCHLKIWTCGGILRQMFIRVYKLEIQSVMLVFSTHLCELLLL